MRTKRGENNSVFRECVGGLFACLAMVAVPASVEAARAQCGPTDEVTEQLAERYDERPVGFGLSKGRLIQIYAAPDGSWTILITLPGGRSCILGAGEHWTTIPPDRPRS